ncbi:hypothetical protein PLEOSDRAFT_1089958 [Pleurotus ostreatus PC15]|uniref:Uncharacterized protein n=1 Tax=Pleurotus ostreatus (strain PC15) TaxID=1137138 RepID=A0A067NTU6_PLEO1|nr:hypothetical protein PLEOSDRAFT_1089958 [Pleurotus ostreatus PC15]
MGRTVVACRNDGRWRDMCAMDEGVGYEFAKSKRVGIQRAPSPFAQKLAGMLRDHFHTTITRGAAGFAQAWGMISEPGYHQYPSPNHP